MMQLKCSKCKNTKQWSLISGDSAWCGVCGFENKNTKGDGFVMDNFKFGKKRT